ncbi:MAG TPA: glycosyltransferase family 2 protein, partial [Chloroflexota bacterium]|nr:glycosyltransferase family 2 protein [Chloroflexota bacterium]
MAVPVSVLIPTLDEEVNLPDCLASVAWADQVFVVDSFSHDRTIAIARERGAHVVQHEFESYSRQKNWALDTLPFRHEWVLIVDADERVTPELRSELETVLASPLFAGYYVNRRFIFLGAWIRHAGWYPSWNLRLFRHRLGRYDDRDVHEHIVLDGRAGYLQHDLLHHDRRGLEAYIARHNRYSTLEATARFKAECNAADRARLPVSLLASPVQRK